MIKKAPQNAELFHYAWVSISKRQSPLSTRSPALTWIVPTIPAIGADKVVSIFMASVTIKGVPFSTD